MHINSTRFGDIEVPEEHIIQFSNGIPGFPEEKTFAYLQLEPGSPFSFLQSTTEPNLTFLLADPFAFFNDYEFTLDDDLAAELEVTAENPPQVFNIATSRGKLEDMTVNLMAPVVINPGTRRGTQVILDRSLYPVRQKLFPNGLPQKPAKGGK